MSREIRTLSILFVVFVLILSSVVSANDLKTDISDRSINQINNKESNPNPNPTFDGDTFYSLEEDGHICGFSTVSYSAAWGATSETTYDTALNFSVGQQVLIVGSLHYYWVIRGFVYFDTSTIPSNAVINSATLKLACIDKYEYNSYNVVIQNGQPEYPHKPMEGGDYFEGHYSGDGGSLPSSSFQPGYWSSIDLNTNGISWIQKGNGAVTKLCLRTSRDINGNCPYEGSTNGLYREYVRFFPHEMTPYYAPQLIVTWTIQINPPSVETYPVDGVGYDNAGLRGYLSSDGGATCQHRFKIWRASQPNEWWYVPSDGWQGQDHTGDTFEENVYGLSEGTTYVYQAGAKNSAGETWADNTESFTTLAHTVTLPTVVTNPATNIDFYSVTLNGKLTDDGGASCRMKFQIRRGDDGWFVPQDWKDYGGFWSFSEVATNLESGENYEYRAGAINSAGESWGSWVKFMPAFYFVHLTDPHVVYFNLNRWNDVVENISSWSIKPKFVLCSGDLVEWGMGEGGDNNYYALLSSLYGAGNYNYYIDSSYTIPIYFCPGNHDARLPYQLAPPYSLIYYQLLINPSLYYEKIIGNCAIFSLNSGADCWPWGGFPWNTAPGDALLPEGGGLSSGDLTNLNVDLDNLDGSQNNRDDSNYFKIIMTHHPNVNPTSSDEKDGVFWEKRTEFKQICNQYGVDLLVGGHLHNDNGGNEWDLDGGTWHEGDGTECIVTDSTQYYTWKNITIGKDNSPKFEGEYNIEVGKPNYLKPTLNLDIKCQVFASIYDEKGNFCGVNESGGVEVGIPGALYSRYVFDYEDQDYDINESYTSASLSRDLTKDYKFYLNSTKNGPINFTVDVRMNDGYRSIATYKNVNMYDGSSATVLASKSIVNYKITIKHPDGTTETVTPTIYEGNLRPEKPSTPVGRTRIRLGLPYKYTFVGLDGDYNDKLTYGISWGDGTTSWLDTPPVDSGQPVTAWHSYSRLGTYKIRYLTRDISGADGEISDSLSVTVKLFPNIPGAVENQYNLNTYQQQLLGNNENPYNQNINLQISQQNSNIVNLLVGGCE